MRLAKNNARNREEAGGDRVLPRASTTGRGNRGRTATWPTSRDICPEPGRQWQRNRVHRRPGQPPWKIGKALVLAARRGGGAARPPACAWIGRNGAGPCQNSIGSAAGCDDIVAGSSGCGAVTFGLCGSDRALAKAPRPRSDGQPSSGVGGGNLRGHHIAAARGSGACTKCGPDPLECAGYAFDSTRGGGAGESGLHRGIASSAGASGRGSLAPGVGS